MSKKTAIVMFNLGGPSDQASVQSFLFNLFYDRAIIDIANPWRYLLAKFISYRRAPSAREIYAQIGGCSPIEKETMQQAIALEKKINTQQDKSNEYKVFFFMRYWHPFADEIAQQVKEFNPNKIILLPLYPQFSTTTTASSLKAWNDSCKVIGMNIPTSVICCYPAQQDFIAAHVELLQVEYSKAAIFGQPRILFSAHGLPVKIIEKGDPYQSQVEHTVKHIIKAFKVDNLDYTICYQSKVGPLQWLMPATVDEIKRAAADKVPLVIIPVAFVSEHSETLVELDIEYKELAASYGLFHYFRVPALGINDKFIECLMNLCLLEYLDREVCCNSFKKCYLNP